MNLQAVIVWVLILVALTALFLVIARRQQINILRLKAVGEAFIAGERRMFGFLHDLGEAISRADNQLTMHRLIVEGAMRVTESKGGAIFLLDSDSKCLVPRFYSDECPPLIAANERALELEKANPGALLSYLRLSTVPESEGLLGRVMQGQKPELLADLARDGGFDAATAAHQQGMSLMIASLTSGSRQLGVLAVARETKNPYTQNDFEVFNSITEQSAFALANALAHLEAQAKKQIEAELRSASEIQRILLPDRDPELGGWVVSGKNIPARVLSGDYYDYLTVDDVHFGAVIADVSGKGTPAALLTGMCRSVVRAHAGGNLSPAAVLASVNRLLYPDIREDMFISMLYLVLETSGNQVTLARAGHTYPILWRQRTASVETIQSGGLAVGIDKGDVFERVTKDCSFMLEPGDCLLLYTDGVNEAMNAEGEEFGEERIMTSVATHAPSGAQALLNGLIGELEAFLDGRRSHDDITLIALQKAA